MNQVDAISIFNLRSCIDQAPGEETKLAWDGKTFSANYVLNCQYEGGVAIAYTVNISGKLSSNHKKLESFTGMRKYTYSSPDINEYHEYFLALKDIPLDGDETYLSGYIEDNLGDHIVNAYYIWNTVTADETINRQSTGINYDNPRMDLNVLFTRSSN